MIPATSRVNYFERVCLNGNKSRKKIMCALFNNANSHQFSAPACEKAWIFERVPGFELAGYDDLIEKAVLTRKECQELCLKQKKPFPCRSAEYDYDTFTCRLSSETRRSQPAAYRATTEDVDYLENQCADSRSLGVCDYQEYPGQDLGFGDLQITSSSKEEVRILNF